MTRIWDEKFEGTGYEETWSEGETVGGASVLDEDFAVSSVAGAPANWGSQCLRIVPATGQAVFVRHDLAGAETTLYARVEVIFKSFPDGLAQNSNIALFRINDSGSTTCFQFTIQERGAANNGPYQIQFGENSAGSVSNHNSADVSLDTPYRLEAKYDIAGNAWEWWLDGVSQDSGTFSGGPTDIQNNLHLGRLGTGGGTFEFYFDNVALDDAEQIGAEPNIAVLMAAMDSGGPA